MSATGVALGVSAIVSSITSAIKDIGSGSIAVIKITASVAFAALFGIAVVSLIGLLESVVFGSIVGEVLGLLFLATSVNRI